MRVVDVKREVAKVIEKINKASLPAIGVSVKEFYMHHEIKIHFTDKRFISFVDEKGMALQIAHRVAAELGFVEKPYTGDGRAFRYFEAR